VLGLECYKKMQVSLLLLYNSSEMGSRNECVLCMGCEYNIYY